ncbi:N-acetylmuramoyl-L-alanine amidase [Virgibacillus sp. MSJ-26]|uniref:N-acetylmuramoyl-L-alanine amidase n=1 Tax=Virgibacillus sp. MSJ-26 TaxID=2841522 RepID=UPI001C115573|nr:N-acetylmuramoyl-L-alanine amidase [Virgibacillus sp. MSJ-26]MBU5468691.1 N-acetylmuramoyl-L-alanine amidase [Virgibacillus sp. MSJ-26]
MKNSIMIGIGVLICLFILPTVHAHADSGQLYEIDSEIIELYDEPDQNASILTELTSGDKVTIFEESSGWGKTFFKGEKAWVEVDQLKQEENVQAEKEDVGKPEEKVSELSNIDKESSESVEEGKLYKVKASTAKLRNGPDKDASIISELQEGDKVSIFGESSGWGRTFYNGEEAWISLDVLVEKNASKEAESSEVDEESETEQTTKMPEKEEAKKDQKSKWEWEDLKERLSQKDVEKEELAKSKGRKERQDTKENEKSDETLSGYHVVIDPGHGGKDSGAVNQEAIEKELTLSTAKKVEKQLREKGASVTLTRTDDTYISLDERIRISHSTDTDAFISLHYNTFEDPPARGIHTFYNDGDKNQKFADSIQTSLINHTNLSDRGTKQANFKVLRENKQLALLIELGFISNPEEQKLIQTDNYQEKAAKGIVSGLEEYLK